MLVIFENFVAVFTDSRAYTFGMWSKKRDRDKNLVGGFKILCTTSCHMNCFTDS